MTTIAYILNLLDMAFTLYILKNGGMELNPAVRMMMAAHPLCFPFMKIVVAGWLCWLLSRSQDKLARYGLKLATFMYGAVDVWHIVNIAIASLW